MIFDNFSCIECLILKLAMEFVREIQKFVDKVYIID